MLVSTLLLLTILFPQFIFSDISPRVAVIGAGIGGTSCTYFLNELFLNQVTVSLFERAEIGGRLKLMDMHGDKYESGGSIIHPRNKYMIQFSKLLGLGIRKPLSGTLGIYNGEKFVFKESEYYIYTIANLFWQYGLSVFHLYRDIKSLLDDFCRIYKLQDKGYAYTSVDLLLDSMNPTFTNMTKKSINDILLEKGYSEKFLNDIVQSVMMVNYGQSNNISGFAGYVSLAGAENDLWSIEGGNRLIPEGLLKNSIVNLIRANVLEVALLPDESFSVKYQEAASNGEVKSKNFDIVVLCTPLIRGNTNIRFVNFSKNFKQFERTYHQTVSTFVKGTLNPSLFNEDPIPEEVLISNSNLYFNSISKNSPVNVIKYEDTKTVYKVFSQKPLNRESIDKLFDEVELVKDRVWLAYPHYKPPDKFVPFILHPGLYYANAIELAASAIEMSAISAKNIALLIFNFWRNKMDKIDPYEPILRDEL